MSYGLSIYFYTYSQRTIGAAQTSTYYACALFIGVLLSILLLGESLTLVFCIAFILMAVGMLLAARAEVNKNKRRIPRHKCEEGILRFILV